MKPQPVTPRGEKQTALFHRTVIDLWLTLVKRSACQWVRNIANKSQIQSQSKANNRDSAHPKCPCLRDPPPTPMPARCVVHCSIISFCFRFAVSSGKCIFVVRLMNHEWFAVKVERESLKRPPTKYISDRGLLPEGFGMLHFFPVDLFMRISTVAWFNFYPLSLLISCKSLHPCGCWNLHRSVVSQQ